MDTKQKIEDAVQKPKAVTVDGMTVQGRDVREIIEADKYLRTLEAVKKPSKGIRFTKMSASGAK